ncbi:MAG: ArsA family ATPase [Candidatus Hodarchaeota archaeon]
MLGGMRAATKVVAGGLGPLSSLDLVFFGGKGGVGKTSNAGAFGTWIAENTGKNVLVASTDPAHSLGDVFEMELEPGAVTAVPGIPNLHLLEIDVETCYDEFKESLMPGDDDLVKRADGEGKRFLDELQEILGKKPPGIDETFAFMKVLELAGDSNHDMVVIDTAPTGHTVRLLGRMEFLTGSWGALMKGVYKLEKSFNTIKKAFGKARGGGADLKLVEFDHLRKQLKGMKKDLQDPGKTSFVVVLVPEKMVIRETERLLTALVTMEIPVRHLVVNQVLPPAVDCDYCRRRYDGQQAHLEEIDFQYDDEFNVVKVPFLGSDVRGLEKLRDVGKHLFT